jgi:SdrD B-like domain
MTKQRTIAALAGIGLLVGIMLLVVLPALASPAGSLVPPASSRGIVPVDVPTGGQSNDCAIFHSSAANQFRIANPKSQPYSLTVNGVPVTFNVTLNPADAQNAAAYANGKYLDFDSTGAAVVDVGIKGGTDETRYNYSGQVSGGGPNLGSVSSDGIMHAPAQTTDSSTGLPTQLYSVSNLTFCFNLLPGSVSGKVFQDTNQNGTNDTGDSPLAWTVRLYKNGGVVATTSSSSADGSYTFNVPLDASATYAVCEMPPSGTWAQTKPGPKSTNVCSGAGELPKGYTFKPTSSTQSVSGEDFGNVPTVPCAQPMTSTLDDGTTYDVQLAACKTGQTFVFNSGTTNSGNPFVSIYAGDQTMQNRQPMVERIKFPNPLNADGTFKYTKLNYTDAFPFDANALQPMPACKLDPRTDPASLVLANAYTADSAKTSVLPTISGTMATSCLISSSAYVDAQGKAWFVAYVYSDIDGMRSST